MTYTVFTAGFISFSQAWIERKQEGKEKKRRKAQHWFQIIYELHVLFQETRNEVNANFRYGSGSFLSLWYLCQCLFVVALQRWICCKIEIPNGKFPDSMKMSSCVWLPTANLNPHLTFKRIWDSLFFNFFLTLKGVTPHYNHSCNQSTSSDCSLYSEMHLSWNHGGHTF